MKFYENCDKLRCASHGGEFRLMMMMMIMVINSQEIPSELMNQLDDHTVDGTLTWL